MNKFDVFAAKSDRDNATLWLPFRVHAWDTAEIISIVWNQWIAYSISNSLSTQLFPNTDLDTARERSCQYCKLLALLHDIGKLTPAFQCRIKRSIEGYDEFLNRNRWIIPDLADAARSPHSLAGQVILEKYGFSQETSCIIGFHHGKGNDDLLDQWIRYPENYFGKIPIQKQAWQDIWDAWIKDALQQTGFNDLKSMPKPNVKSQMLLTGLLIMADWIASNPHYFPYIPTETTLDHSECERRAIVAWENLGLPEILQIQDPCCDPESFCSRFTFYPNAMQKKIMDIITEISEPGLLILEAPMGLGKTEAALAAAEILTDQHGTGGVYFGLPTQATANGIFGRIKDWASSCDPELHSIRLAHGSAELNEEYQSLFHGTATDSGDENVIVHEWFEGRKQALLADFVIATVDQFLLASLKQKHVMLRHLGLSGKVVILDECHAYDAYMNIYLDRTLTWMGAYGVPVIVLSATLPPQRRRELVAAYLNTREVIQLQDNRTYPVLTWTSGRNVMQKALPFELEECEISIIHISDCTLATRIEEHVKEGGCAAVIVNTVAYAQALCERLKSELEEYEVICIHSRFIATDRARIEKSLLERVGKHSTPVQRQKLIVVGTQVLEQSLDLDFDFMVTELCPIDLLLQRSGRLHRHQRNRPPACQKAELAILVPEHPSENSIYDTWLLRKTEQYLPEILKIPSCIPELVGKVYEAMDDNSEDYRNYCNKIQNKQENAKKYCIKSNLLNSRRTTRLFQLLDDDAGNSEEAERSVRDGEETIEVLVLRRDSEESYSLVSGETVYNATVSLTEQEAMRIARERLRLPQSFSKSYCFCDALKTLDVLPPRWRESPWLSGEMLLLLDEHLETEVTGKRLRYSLERGLEVLKHE